MSKYKVGDKVVLAVTGTTETGYFPRYVLNDNFNLWKQSIDELVEPLSTYTEPLEAKIRRQAAEITRLLAKNKGLKEDFEKSKRVTLNMGRLAGQNEAWELAKKIKLIFQNSGTRIGEVDKIFGNYFFADIFEKYTYPEAAAKVAEWEKAKEEIKVGDVVCSEGKYGVVISEGTICFRGFTDDGTPFEWYKERCTKTGRHIDIDSFLKQIGGEE